MKVAQGATITTGADGDVYLESHAGYITAIKHDSVVAVDEISVTSTGGKVTEEKTLLDLKSGNLVAKLDPTKKAVNNYQVRTPKGVAAARGTVFTVSYKGGNYSISVVNGVVTVIPPAGAGVTGTAGLGVQVKAGETSLASGTEAVGKALPSGQVNNSQSAAAADVRELLAVAVATVAVAAQNNIGGTTAADAAAVAKAVFTAVPGAAEQAGALIKQSTPAGQNNSAVVDAIKAATPPAAQEAFSAGATSGTFTPNTQTTAPTTTTPSTTTPSTTTKGGAETTTTPQPIDPSTVSRSG